VVFDIAGHLVTEGHYVLVVSPEDGPFRERLLALGADVIIDPLCLSGHDKDFRMLADKFDIVIANTIVTWPIINQLAHATRVFWYVHETELVGHLARLHPELGRDAGMATVWAGSSLAASALERLAISSTILEYGVEAFPSSKPVRGHDKTVVSVLATYEPRKGQDLALLAIQGLSEELRAACEFQFAGRINDEAFYDSIRDMDQDDKLINHLGILTLEEYRNVLSSTDIVVCPSRDDTLPLVSLDALANGKILICTGTTGTSSYITDGVSGYISETGAPNELLQALKRALAEKDKWPAMSSAARQVFHDNFSISRFRLRITEQLASSRDIPADLRLVSN
jgi:glycosyltransferase involved in cell wall biosynthesis